MQVLGLSWGELCGYIAGICTAVCFLPQTIRTIRTHDVNGLSLWSYSIYAIGVLCWILYGFYLSSLQMIMFNTISLVLALFIIAEIIWWRCLVRSRR